MKKTARPLSLRRETVRTLAAPQLAAAQGGDFTTLIVGRLTGDNEQASGCAICVVRPPDPFPGAGSNGQGGCATEIFTRIPVIFP